MPDIRLQDVRRLRLRRGDVLVLRLGLPASKETLEVIAAEAERVFPNNQLLVLDPDMELQVVSVPSD